MITKKSGNNLIIRIDKDEEILSCLKKACEENGIRAGSVTGIGALSKAEVGLVDLKTKQYKTKKFEGMREIVSLTGNVTMMNGWVRLHLHVALGDENLNLIGGHLVSGEVGVTCEVIIMALDTDIDRKLNAELGVHLMDF